MCVCVCVSTQVNIWVSKCSTDYQPYTPSQRSDRPVSLKCLKQTIPLRALEQAPVCVCVCATLLWPLGSTVLYLYVSHRFLSLQGWKYPFTHIRVAHVRGQGSSVKLTSIKMTFQRGF